MVILTVELERLVVALLVGMLIGLDRERAETRRAQQVFAGVRTCPLIALAGALPMVVLEHTGPLLVVVSFFAVAAVISVIILPLLPNQGYGPWQVFNPFHIWSDDGRQSPC